jgi:hypothetical protein
VTSKIGGLSVCVLVNTNPNDISRGHLRLNGGLGIPHNHKRAAMIFISLQCKVDNLHFIVKKFSIATVIFINLITVAYTVIIGNCN